MNERPVLDLSNEPEWQAMDDVFLADGYHYKLVRDHIAEKLTHDGHCNVDLGGPCDCGLFSGSVGAAETR